LGKSKLFFSFFIFKILILEEYSDINEPSQFTSEVNENLLGFQSIPLNGDKNTLKSTVQKNDKKHEIKNDVNSWDSSLQYKTEENYKNILRDIDKLLVSKIPNLSSFSLISNPVIPKIDSVATSSYISRKPKNPPTLAMKGIKAKSLDELSAPKHPFRKVLNLMGLRILLYFNFIIEIVNQLQYNVAVKEKKLKRIQQHQKVSQMFEDKKREKELERQVIILSLLPNIFIHSAKNTGRINRRIGCIWNGC
jgi:hypothetical protein